MKTMATKAQFERYTAVVDAYTTKERGNDTIYILKDNIPTETRDALLDIQYNLGTTLDLSYEIVARATRAIEDIGFENLNNDETIEHISDFASPYTGVLLGYLNPLNQYDISRIIIDDGEVDIASACGVWFDQQVITACEKLIAYILETESKLN